MPGRSHAGTVPLKPSSSSTDTTVQSLTRAKCSSASRCDSMVPASRCLSVLTRQ
jgi:hypothetical protein